MSSNDRQASNRCNLELEIGYRAELLSTASLNLKEQQQKEEEEEEEHPFPPATFVDSGVGWRFWRWKTGLCTSPQTLLDIASPRARRRTSPPPMAPKPPQRPKSRRHRRSRLFHGHPTRWQWRDWRREILRRPPRYLDHQRTFWLARAARRARWPFL